MIRAGRFYAVLITDGYEVHDDVSGLVSRVEFPLSPSKTNIRQAANADVAQRDYDLRRQQREVSPQTGR